MSQQAFTRGMSYSFNQDIFEFVDCLESAWLFSWTDMNNDPIHERLQENTTPTPLVTLSLVAKMQFLSNHLSVCSAKNVLALHPKGKMKVEWVHFSLPF